MKKLTETDFRKSQLFLKTKSRHLEQMLFTYHFHHEEGSRKDVIKELIKYQNQDGGFGKALEPDLRMKHSSVVATKFALQILIDIETPVTEKIINDCITYLMNNYDKEKQVWSLVTSKVMDAARARIGVSNIDPIINGINNRFTRSNVYCRILRLCKARNVLAPDMIKKSGIPTGYRKAIK